MRGYYYYYYNIVLLMINIVVQLWNKLPGEVVSANSVSALILRQNSMNVSFLMFCFSALCLFSLRIFRAVLRAFWAYLSSSALYCFYCTVSVLVDKIFIHSFIHSFTDIQFGVFLPREALALYKYSDVVYAMTRYVSYRPACRIVTVYQLIPHITWSCGRAYRADLWKSYHPSCISSVCWFLKK